MDLEFEFCVDWLDAALAYPPRPVEVFDMLASCTSGLKMMIEFMGRGLPRGDGFVIYSLAIERCRNRSGHIESFSHFDGHFLAIFRLFAPQLSGDVVQPYRDFARLAEHLKGTLYDDVSAII